MKRKIALLLLIAMLSLVLSGCRVEGMGTLAVYSSNFDFELAAEKISSAYGKPVSVDLLKLIGKEKTKTLLGDAENGIFSLISHSSPPKNKC